MITHLYSGGAFFIKGLAEAAYTACRLHGIPKCVAGTSSGALVAAVAAIKGFPFMHSAAMQTNLQQAHKHKAFNDRGELSFWSIVRFVLGKSPINQELRPILRKLISYNEYLQYQQDEHKTKCFILTADIDDAIPTLWEIHTIHNYELFLDILEASCRMQGMCEPILLPDHTGELFAHWDGGQFDHIPTGIFTRVETSEVVAFYTRGENYNLPNKKMIHRGAFAKVMRMVEIDNQEKSKNDQYRIEQICKDKDINLWQVFIERHLQNFYDTDIDRQAKQIEAGREAVFKAFQK